MDYFDRLVCTCYDDINDSADRVDDCFENYDRNFGSCSIVPYFMDNNRTVLYRECSILFDVLRHFSQWLVTIVNFTCEFFPKSETKYMRSFTQLLSRHPSFF